MTTIILTAMVSGLLSAYGMYILMQEKERREYKEYGNRLDDLLKRTQNAEQAGINAIKAVQVMSGTVGKNRNELDEIIPEFKNLKRWVYEYVSYKPNLKGSKNESVRKVQEGN